MEKTKKTLPDPGYLKRFLRWSSNAAMQHIVKDTKKGQFYKGTH
jgi:hypothetical protein